MTLSMYQASVPVFLHTLEAVSAFLRKGAAHAVLRKIEPSVLLAMRLYPDMFPLTRQVQLTADFAKGTSARLAGVENPKFADDETSFEALEQRIAKTATFVRSLTPAQIDGSETREITIPIGGQPHSFRGQPYLLHFGLPNFFFHASTAYDILRHAGVELGKRDFLGSLKTE
jgi:uncharacterized protein